MLNVERSHDRGQFQFTRCFGEQRFRVVVKPIGSICGNVCWCLCNKSRSRHLLSGSKVQEFPFQARKAQAERLAQMKEEAPATPAPAPKKNNAEETVQDKENMPPKTDADSVEKKTQDLEEMKQDIKDQSCAKCTKRRLTTDSRHNNALCESSSPNKRARRDSESVSDTCESKSGQHEDVSSSHESMQTEQISNLVNRFNSGLSGFLGTKLASNHHTDSESIVPHCGSRVTFSESLGSRPVIALTVWVGSVLPGILELTWTIWSRFPLCSTTTRARRGLFSPKA